MKMFDMGSLEEAFSAIQLWLPTFLRDHLFLSVHGLEYDSWFRV